MIPLLTALAFAADPSIESDVDRLVMLHREGVVALTSTDPALRPRLDTAGLILGEQRHELEISMGSALEADLSAWAAAGFKGRPKLVEAFLTAIEADPDLRDGDKIAFAALIGDLQRDLASTRGESPRRDGLRERLSTDKRLLDEVIDRYRKEAAPLLQGARGMVITREAWLDYVAFVRTVYSEQRVLADVDGELSAIPAERGSRRTDGALEIYGWNLPNDTFVLTFDDGPSGEHTAEILDILDRYHTKAVFFEVGKNVAGNEALTKRIVEDGHLLGNHTWSHANLPRLDEAGIAAQLDDSKTAIEAASGIPVALFRPPYGARDERVLTAVEQRAERAYIWNVDSRDWADPIPESIAASTLDQVDHMGRGVILFHDVHPQTVAALPLVLDGLAERGKKLVLWDGTTIIGAPEPEPAPSTASPAVAAGTKAAGAVGSLDPTAPKPSSAYHASWAVVIGIDAYTKWPKLSYAAADAKGVADVIESKYGFQPDHVIGLYDGDATKSRILAVLGDELPAKVGPDDRVFVFYAGHGATRELPGGTQRGYIIPVDSDPAELQSTAISMTELQDVHEAMPSKHVYFVMDACYSGIALTRGGSAPGGDPRRYLGEITRRPARQILTAGGADETVSDYGPGNHSIFTWTFLQGLDGLADLNGDGVITASEMGGYVAPRVSSVSRQTPAFGNLVGSGGGEFVFELGAGSELLSEATTSEDPDKLAMEAELKALREKLAAVEASRGTIDPAVEAARYNRIGLDFFRIKDYPKAVDAFKRAAELDPENVQAVNNLGYSYYQLERYPEAITAIERATVLDPQRAVAWLNLGDAKDKSGDHPGAVAAWTKYLALAPDSQEAARLHAAMDAAPE